MEQNRITYNNNDMHNFIKRDWVDTYADEVPRSIKKGMNWSARLTLSG